jgi:hypothetical protein
MSDGLKRALLRKRRIDRRSMYERVDKEKAYFMTSTSRRKFTRIFAIDGIIGADRRNKNERCM